MDGGETELALRRATSTRTPIGPPKALWPSLSSRTGVLTNKGAAIDMRTRRKMLCLVLASVTTLALITIGLPAGGAESQAQLKARLISVSDLPTGWSVNNGTHITNAGCLLPIFRDPHLTAAKSHFLKSGGLPEMDEEVATSRSPAKTFAANVKRLSACHSVAVTSQGQTVNETVGQLSSPKVVGAHSSAYGVSFTVNGTSVAEDIVVLRYGSVLGAIALGDQGTVDTSTLSAFITVALTKIEGRPFPPIPSK